LLSTNCNEKISAICCNSIIEVFKNDESGEASLDAVKLISRMVKSKGYNVNDAAINSFLHLRLKDELAPLADRESERMKGKKRQKTVKQHISKKQRKVMKENKEVEKELREAEDVVTKEEKDRNVSVRFDVKVVSVYVFKITNLL
jgi:nucleolar complex protein 3